MNTMQNNIKQVTQETIAQSRALRRKASARYARDKAAECARRAQLKAWQGDTEGESLAFDSMRSWASLAVSYGVNV